MSAREQRRDGQLYYLYETSSHNLISANVTDGQLYLLTASPAGERGWRRAEGTLRRVVSSFTVPM